MSKPTQFENARLKVQRASRHIHDLNVVLQTFIQTDICKLHIEEDLHTGNYSVKIDAMAKFPPEIPLLIGDAVHNLRTALDYIIVEITGIDDDWISFPSGKERDDIVTKSPSYRTIKKALPDFADFILDTIQPYAGGDFKIWELGKLDNADKHKLLIPTINIAGLANIEIEDEHHNRFSNMTVSIRQGTIMGIVDGLGSIKIHNQGKPILKIRFGDGTPFKDDAVIPTLTQLCEFTFKVIESLERFYFGNAANPNAIPS